MSSTLSYECALVVLISFLFFFLLVFERMDLYMRSRFFFVSSPFFFCFLTLLLHL